MGVDHTGALIITGEGDIPMKVYVCLFTRGRIRVNYLEVAEDLNSDIFLQLFRIFALRRSCPLLIIGDNAANFVGTAPFIEHIINDPKVQQTLTNRQYRWKFITPRASWDNGFTERMIGPVNSCLKKTLHRSKLNLQEMRMVVAEIEIRINNRPLTYLDHTSVHLEVITPSYLVNGRE